MLIVQKYGGATLSDAQKIRAVAQRIANARRQGHKVVAVVSAMGSSTNELIHLAHQISPQPSLREMDMLLSTGERVSMSLLTMALHDLKVPAISFTGSQAGILTDDAHVNAFIQDVKPFRVEGALDRGQVVVLAGFQGVSPVTKEITTLGRGGTDTTALAIATALNADHCEILKEVPAVFSADPRIVGTAHALHELTYSQLAEMTFWGAKVLHYRCVELASRSKIPIYVGPAHNQADGTWVRPEGTKMYEKTQILSLNSYEKVLFLTVSSSDPADSLALLEAEFLKNQIASPQYLSVEKFGEKVQILLTGPQEVMTDIERWSSFSKNWKLDPRSCATITATCAGATSTVLASQLFEKLKSVGIQPISTRWSSMSLTFIVEATQRNAALQALHEMI